uniref:DUF4005 domain-containing protein n=1 Tax=Kalanchoe fedtschenkoi TaxID=63787 RepID=A0A7N0TVP3_KALFE
MGKASRWLRSLLTFKKTAEQPPSDVKPSKDRRRWSFVKSTKHRHHHTSTGTSILEKRGDPVSEYGDLVDPEKHAIAVAAATAAVAEAAVAAARAAAAVVKLTSSGKCDSTHYSAARSGGGRRPRWAAVVIQSAFRGYLARRALKALKALVRLQALVRGHIARKQTADQVRQMQALLRVQARARAGRALLSESSQSSSKSSHHHPPGPGTPEKFEQIELRSKSPRRNQPSVLKRNYSRSDGRGTNFQVRPHRDTNWINHSMDDRAWDPLMRTCPLDDENSGKILEIDPGNPNFTSKRKDLFHALHHTLASDNRSHKLTTSKDLAAHQGFNSCEAMSLNPSKFSCELEEASFCTADNSPRFYSASSIGGGSSRGGSFTPTNSDILHSYLSGYSDYPNYMSYTESSKAKLRSLSAPKQRPQYERSSSTKRYLCHALKESKSGAQRLSALHASFADKAYPGSGRLDKLGMPVTRGDTHASLYDHI